MTVSTLSFFPPFEFCWVFIPLANKCHNRESSVLVYLYNVASLLLVVRMDALAVRADDVSVACVVACDPLGVVWPSLLSLFLLLDFCCIRQQSLACLKVE